MEGSSSLPVESLKAQEPSGLKALRWTAGVQRGEGMSLASKAAWAGIVCVVLTTGISGPRPTLLASGASLSKEVSAVGHRNDVKKMLDAQTAGKLGVRPEG